MRGGKTNSAFCEICRREVQFFTSAHTILIFRVNAEFLETLFRSNQIHAVGENAICAGSLIGYFKHEIRFVED